MPQYQGVWSLQQQMQALTSGQWATDPLFDYTTLLLQADNAANSAQNNTFLDSSTNAFAITRNGNTTQGTFSPFSATGWGNFFDGSGDFLTTPSNTAFEFGTGDFTIEFWAYVQNSGETAFVGTRTGDTVSTIRWSIFTLSGALSFQAYNSADAAIGTLSFQTSLPKNTFVHCAVVRSGTSFRLYQNGVQSTSSLTSSDILANNSTVIRVGDFDTSSIPDLNGYISNLRITKGGALYTSTFTPSTTPLTTTVSAGTVSLLTCQSNRFIDNSTNAFSITVNGTPSVQAFSPFAPQYQWTSDVIGGSGYFDGNADYLNLSNPSQLAFGSGDWYIETWVYVNTIGGDQFIYDGRPASTNGLYITLFIQNVSNKLDFYTNTGDRILSNSALTQGQWYHVVLSKASGTTRMFINGVAQTQTYADSNTYINGASRPNIGAGGPTVSSYLNGYLSGFRVVVGTGLTSVTVPTAPPTAVTNTQLLLNFTNAGILDGTMKNNLETVNNAQISTSVVKYGSGSMYFDGTGDYLTAPASPNNNLNIGDFTIEFWVYRANLTGDVDPIGCGNVSTTGYQVRIKGTTGYVQFLVIGGATITTTTGIAATTWTHIAIVRSGTTVKIYINGTDGGGSGTVGNSGTVTTELLVVGANRYDYSNTLNGYMDDVRITKGIARYTQNFIPPSVALPRQ